LAKKFFRADLQKTGDQNDHRCKADTNEAGSDKYSGSWRLEELINDQLPHSFFPPSPPHAEIGPWEVVSSYSSATAPGLHGISCAEPADCN
jgi:hypothetical protein